MLLAAHPLGAKKKDCDGRLPLHYAAWTGASRGFVQQLLAAYPLGAREKDRDGKLPLNYALENKASDGVVQALLAVYSLDALYEDDPFASVYKNGKLLLPCDVDIACIVTEEVLAALALAQIRLLAELESSSNTLLVEHLRGDAPGALESLYHRGGDALGERGAESTIRLTGRLSSDRRVRALQARDVGDSPGRGSLDRGPKCLSENWMSTLAF